ncbi:MAG: rod shape-determining protein MreD [Pseudomonadota bacterium]
MKEQTFTRIWGMRLTFALIICIVLFFSLLPLETTPKRWVGPDLILVFACAWSLRRPEYVPAIALAALFLLADLLLLRPPGLWALLALLACENLKARARTTRYSGFANEWLTVCVILTVVALAYRAALSITLLDPPPFGLSVFELVMTMLFYPLVVGVTHILLGVRHTIPGELDSGGRAP